MEIVLADNKTLKNSYIDFMLSIYKNNKYFKDINIIFAKNFLFKEDLFSKKCDIYPILIMEGSIILACTSLILYPASTEVFLSFFEALPDQKKAVDEIIVYARKIAKENNKTKIVIGINGQVSYTVGLLANNYDKPQQFGSGYNPDYYIDYFEQQSLLRKEAVSYIYDFDKIKFNEQVLKQVYSDVSFRLLDKWNFKRDILIFGDLCNRVLGETPYYIEKTKEEMYNSLRQLKFVLTESNLVFAMKDRKEVGFIFMHPDYNEFISGQKITPLKMLVGSLFKRKKVKTLLLNTIGVLPEYREYRTIIGLFNEAHKIVKDNYKRAVSTFIIKDNSKSDKLCSSFATGELNKYYIYELEV
jgi:hypothetical protein